MAMGRTIVHVRNEEETKRLDQCYVQCRYINICGQQKKLDRGDVETVISDHKDVFGVI